MKIVFACLGIIVLSIISGTVTIQRFCYLCIEKPDDTKPLEEVSDICEYCRKPICKKHSIPYKTDPNKRRCLNCLP